MHRDDVRKADQERQLEPARTELLRQLVQVDRLCRAFRIGGDLDLAARVDAEVRRSPASDLIALRASIRRPGLVLLVAGTRGASRHIESCVQSGGHQFAAVDRQGRIVLALRVVVELGAGGPMPLARHRRTIADLAQLSSHELSDLWQASREATGTLGVTRVSRCVGGARLPVTSRAGSKSWWAARRGARGRANPSRRQR